MKNFVIVGTQRTGSSILGEIIGTHPKITCGWEWTLKGIFDNKIKVANTALNGDFSILRNQDQKHMAEVFHKGIEWLGFRRLFSSNDKWIIHPRFAPTLFVEQFEQHIKWIKSIPDLHIIHIVRTNNIDWLKSRYLAKKHNLFYGKSYPSGTKIRVPVNIAVKCLFAKEWVDKRLQTIKTSNPYLSITYEELFSDENLSLERIFKFFNYEHIGVSQKNTKLKKQSVGNAENYIENYEELFTILDRKYLLKSTLDYSLP